MPELEIFVPRVVGCARAISRRAEWVSRAGLAEKNHERDLEWLAELARQEEIAGDLKATAQLEREALRAEAVRKAPQAPKPPAKRRRGRQQSKPAAKRPLSERERKAKAARIAAKRRAMGLR
jgi:hypothetical protein